MDARDEMAAAGRRALGARLGDGRDDAGGAGHVWTLFGAWLAGVPFVAALPAALAAFAGRLTSA